MDVFVPSPVKGADADMAKQNALGIVTAVNHGGDDGEDQEEEADASTMVDADNNDRNQQQDLKHHKMVVDLDSMKDAVFFIFPDRNDRLSRFWLLLISAAIIATSGVVGDSSATVIGAMIVAPLMIPILGIMLSVVLTDGPNFRFSVLLVVTGIATCIVIGTIFGFLANADLFNPDNNAQVSARVSPKLTDLIGALATGAVGSFSLVRKDISGALPGVAISISLVPPLCVVGLMFSIGEFHDAGGAMLLFTCNFMAIQVTGVIIMYIYGVHKMGRRPRAGMQKTVFAILVLLLGAIAVPLALTSLRIASESEAENCIRTNIEAWAEPLGWSPNIVIAKSGRGTVDARVLLAGPPPFPDKEALAEEGIGLQDACPYLSVLTVTFVPITVYEFQ